MRKITIIKPHEAPRHVHMISSKRDGRERIIQLKAVFKDKPHRTSECVLSEIENWKFEKGEAARTKGGLYKVRMYTPEKRYRTKKKINHKNSY